MRRLPTLVALASTVVAATAWAGNGTTGGHVLRVGYVEYEGARQDHGVGQTGYEGFVRAVKRLGLKGQVIDVTPFLDPAPAIRTLAGQRYDLVYDAAPHALRSVFAVARAFPDVKFVVPDVRHDEVHGAPENVQTFVLRVEQAGYLAGYLAGLMEKRRPGRDVVSSVGGQAIPQVDPFIAGYRAGARAADPSITLLNGYSHDFLGPEKCRSIALAQISRGAGVIFNVAGSCGLGALQAAKEKHVWGVGVDIDQSFLGPHILTSVVKRYDVVAFRLLRALKERTLQTGGTSFFGLKENGVGLGRISRRVPRAIVTRLVGVRAAIVSGRIQAPTTVSR